MPLAEQEPTAKGFGTVFIAAHIPRPHLFPRMEQGKSLGIIQVQFHGQTEEKNKTRLWNQKSYRRNELPIMAKS